MARQAYSFGKKEVDEKFARCITAQNESEIGIRTKFLMYLQEYAKVYTSHAGSSIERKPDSASNEAAAKQKEPTG
jgi:hypothetical protein